MPEETVEVAVQKPPKKKRRWLRRIILILIVAAIGAGAAHYAGLVDLSDYVEQAMELIP
jgi:hypothetical protein